ncbi:MAG: magnesium/cobalt transporter CorA, partial [Planctomycetia bacterium]|nr:magnesium/cobalt transporter CorA [Planctomycetia bacterium]
AEELRECHGLVWIDLEDPDPEEELLVYQRFYPIHPLSIEDIVKPRADPDSPPHFPKAEEFRDYLFVIANPLAPKFLERLQGKGALDQGTCIDRVATQLSTVLTERLLITHHYELLQPIELLRTFLLKHTSHSDRGPDYLFHLVLDNMVDQYIPFLDYIDEELDKLEVDVFARPSKELLSRLLELKRRIIGLRKTLVYEREVLARLARGEFELIEAREMVYYRNVYDHLVRFTELTEGSRDMAADLMQSHLASMSNRLNEIMKVLTMISTVVLPMTLISGIYGMNFENNVWPDFKESRWGFPGTLLIMALTGLIAYTWFRWRKWL